MKLKLFKIRFAKLADGIYNIIYPSQYLLTSSVIRIQELDQKIVDIAVENKAILSLESIIDKYMIKYGSLSYFYDWAAFNFTDNHIKIFFNLFKKNLLDKEKKLYSIIDKNIKNWKTGKYTIICSTNNRSDILHELAHSIFYLNENYQKEIKELLKKVKFFNKLKKKLIKFGYDNDSIIDEAQAYLCTSSKKFLKDMFNITDSSIDCFKLVFKRYKNEYCRIKNRPKI